MELVMKRLLLLITLFLVSPHIWAEEVFYCTDEIATGTFFDRSKNQWIVTKFKNQRRTVKFNKDRSSVVGFEEGRPPLICETFFDTIHSHLITCQPEQYRDSQLLINMKSMRYEFLAPSIYGYQDDQTDEDRTYDNTTLYAGKCEGF